MIPSGLEEFEDTKGTQSESVNHEEQKTTQVLLNKYSTDTSDPSKVYGRHRDLVNSYEISVSQRDSMMGATSGAGNAYPSVFDGANGALT